MTGVSFLVGLGGGGFVDDVIRFGGTIFHGRLPVVEWS